MLKKIKCAAAIAAALLAAGCSSDNVVQELSVSTDDSTEGISADTTSAEPETDTDSDSETSDETEAVTIQADINPLTGESGYNTEAAGKRPVAIMVNNLKAALPQYGIEQADIIYELPVEGRITRLMAVYADYTAVPDVCSVRSCRYYYPLLCLGMDAIYCHWGSDQTIAIETLNRTGIDHLDGESESGLFYRDAERAATYASEHTGYLKGSELADKIAEKGFRTDIADEYAGTIFSFAADGEIITPDEMTASSVTLNFSAEYYSTFTYDEATNQYMKYHSGSAHVDGKTGNQLGFENVFVLQTNVYSYDGYRLGIDLDGGSGYYITGGGAQTITWSKPSETSPITFYASDGTEITVNVGESYIGILGTDDTISIS